MEQSTLPDKPQWLTGPETADYLGIHINHLRTIPPERLPFYRVAGRLRRYRVEDVVAFIEASKVDTTPTQASA